jgi:putative SOS response-associated peptidase YedK
VCGRYSLTAQDPSGLRQRFPLGETVPIEPRYNVAPSDDVVAVTTDREGAPRGELLRWGLVPHWAKDAKIGPRLINARGESVAEKPAFRDAFARRRCLIVADGFYEWQAREGQRRKQPWWIAREDHAPFAFAGLWSTWRLKDEPDAPLLRTCTIVTTQASAALSAIHERMPVILDQSTEELWLSHDAEPAALQDLLRPFDHTAAREVGFAVNDAHHDAPDCLDPPQDEPALF